MKTMRHIFIITLLIGLSLTIASSVSASGYRWDEFYTIPDKSIEAIAVDNDADTIFLYEGYDGLVYFSADGGETFGSDDVNDSEGYVDVDGDSYFFLNDDGSRFVVLDDNSGRAWVSTTTGATWTERFKQQVAAYFIQVSGSSDGQKLIIAPNGDQAEGDPMYLYTSANGGDTWATSTGSGADYWDGAVSSADGGVFYAAGANSGAKIIKSTNGGSSWSTLYLNGNDGVNFNTLVTSDDGQNVLFTIGCCGGEEVIYSLNEGSTWATSTLTGVTKLRMSRDGTKVFAFNSTTDQMFSSVDGGATWEEEIQIDGEDWNSLVFDEDGSFAFGALEDNGTLYRGTFDDQAPEITAISTTTATSNFGLYFDTDELASSTLFFGVDSILENSIEGEYLTDEHVFEIGELESCTDYIYAIRTEDELGNAATSSTATFSTVGCPEPDPEPTPSSHRSGGGRSSRAPAKVPEAVGAPADAPAVSAPLAFARSLTVGDTGPDVLALQKFLNANGFVVAASGPGSVGNETSMFGGLTRAALVRFQQAKGIVPAVGYFGPITRGVVNGLIK